MEKLWKEVVERGGEFENKMRMQRYWKGKKWRGTMSEWTTTTTEGRKGGEREWWLGKRMEGGKNTGRKGK